METFQTNRPELTVVPAGQFSNEHFVEGMIHYLKNGKAIANKSTEGSNLKTKFELLELSENQRFVFGKIGKNFLVAVIRKDPDGQMYFDTSFYAEKGTTDNQEIMYAKFKDVIATLEEKKALKVKTEQNQKTQQERLMKKGIKIGYLKNLRIQKRNELNAILQSRDVDGTLFTDKKVLTLIEDYVKIDTLISVFK